jgi:ATP phosphoribosyltransferase regulatory subunit
MPELMLTIDTVESRGFEYHTGVTFSLFAASASGELGRGGHYRTEAGEAATGVTLLMDAVLAGLAAPPLPLRLLLPAGTALATASALRAEGWVTIAALTAVADVAAEARRIGCSHVLRDGRIEAVNG